MRRVFVLDSRQEMFVLEVFERSEGRVVLLLSDEIVRLVDSMEDAE